MQLMAYGIALAQVFPAERFKSPRMPRGQPASVSWADLAPAQAFRAATNRPSRLLTCSVYSRKNWVSDHAAAAIKQEVL